MSNFQKAIKVFALCLAGFIILNIISGVLWFLSLFANIGFKSESREDFSEVYQGITKLDVDLARSKLELKEGSAFKVEIKNAHDHLKISEKNGILKIKEKNFWLWNTHASSRITVYVPKNINLNTIRIDAGAGTIYMDQINSDILDINQGAGILTITNCKFLKTNIDGGVGEIKVTSSLLNQLDLEAGASKMNIEAQISGASKIECGVGTVFLSLLGNEKDYRISVEKGLGNILINHKEYKNNIVYGNGKNILKIEGGVGSIDVQFKNNDT